jgi:lipopolysaccharide transport system permease protein
VLTVVTVLANMVQFLLALPILLALVALEGRLTPWALLLPLPLLVQLTFTLGVALLVSALTVHFRDIQNILTHVLQIWFFATPVLYAYPPSGRLHTLLFFNPMTHLLVSYQEVLFYGTFHHLRGLAVTAVVAVGMFGAGARLFDRLRDSLAEEV